MLKKVGIFLSLILLVLFCASAFIDSEQTINFETLMPSKFEVCGVEIDSSHSRYKALQTWFSQNENGWHYSPASYVPHYVFSSKTMHVNIMASGAVVNYEFEGNWYQVTKSAETGGLIKSCE